MWIEAMRKKASSKPYPYIMQNTMVLHFVANNDSPSENGPQQMTEINLYDFFC